MHDASHSAQLDSSSLLFQRAICNSHHQPKAPQCNPVLVHHIYILYCNAWPHQVRIRAHREHALQVGEAAGGHAAEAVPGAEHVPAPLAVARVARHAPQNEQRLHRLRPQQVVRVLQRKKEVFGGHLTA